MYLANDVIQNSKRKGPEYGKEFENVLAKAFKHMSEHCAGTNTLKSLDRLLNIWGTRGVYDSESIKTFKSNLHRNDGNSDNIQNSAPELERKRKHEEKSSSSSANIKKVRPTTKDIERSKVKSETIEVNGTIETHVTLNTVIPAGDPPEPDVLIKALLELENSASSDAVVRGKIANLPPEVSELTLLNKLEDKESASKLAIQVRVT